MRLRPSDYLCRNFSRSSLLVGVIAVLPSTVPILPKGSVRETQVSSSRIRSPLAKEVRCCAQRFLHLNGATEVSFEFNRNELSFRIKLAQVHTHVQMRESCTPSREVSRRVHRFHARKCNLNRSTTSLLSPVHRSNTWTRASSSGSQRLFDHASTTHRWEYKGGVISVHRVHVDLSRTASRIRCRASLPSPYSPSVALNCA